MPGTGSVARLAGHMDIGPAGRVTIGGEVVVLLQIGGVATGALVIPGLVAPGPMQPIAGRQFPVGIEVEPALAALVLRPAVPGSAERLQPAARHRDQVLLQRIDAEGVGDRIFVQGAVGAVGADPEFVAIAKERGGDPEMLELGAGEIAQHGRRRRLLHRQRVMRTLPGIELRRMAAGAGLCAHEASRLLRARREMAYERQHDHGSEDPPARYVHDCNGRLLGQMSAAASAASLQRKFSLWLWRLPDMSWGLAATMPCKEGNSKIVINYPHRAGSQTEGAGNIASPLRARAGFTSGLSLVAPFSA